MKALSFSYSLRKLPEVFWGLVKHSGLSGDFGLCVQHSEIVLACRKLPDASEVSRACLIPSPFVYDFTRFPDVTGDVLASLDACRGDLEAIGGF